MQKIAIIGAGISGLSAAHFLKDRYEITIFEKENSPGGLIRCLRIDGNLFHICGGHVFNSKRKEVLDWFWTKFSCEEEFSKADRHSVVFMDNTEPSTGYVIIPYPIENHVYKFDRETQEKVINDFIMIASSNGLKPRNFEEFLKSRFGNTLYNRYFQPYNEKVWRRDLKQVPLSWLEGKLPMPTVPEMIYNNMNHVQEKEFVHSTFWYEKKEGSQYIADKLADGLNIRYNTTINSIKYRDGKWTIKDELFDKVVFCGNIKDMIVMVEGIDLSSYNDAIAALEYHGTTTVFCEIDKNPYSWIYMPSRRHDSHRIICTGNFAQSNNIVSIPGNRITATIEFTDEVNDEIILSNLERIPLHPQYICHRFNKYTYPIQDVNTREMIQDLKRKLAFTGFYFTGRFADWEYYNMDVAIGAAMDLCKTL